MIRRFKNFLKSDAGARKYFLNTSWLLGARGVQMIVALFVGALMARYMGPADYGIYNYVISYIGIFLAISSLGIGTIMVKDILDKSQTENIIMGSGLWLRVAGSVVACFVVVLLAWVTGEDEHVRFFLFIASLQPIARSFEVVSFYFQAKVVSKFTVIAQLISLLIISVLKLVFIALNYPLVWFFYLMILDSSIVAIIMIIEYRYLKQSVFKWKFNLKYSKALLNESWPLIFSGMLVTIYLKIDQVIINYMMDDAATGLYAAAVKLSEAWVSIPWIIGGSLYPALVNSYKENIQAFQTRVSQTYILLIAVAAVIILPIVLFAHPITHFVFGAEYVDSAVVLQLHIGSLLFIFLGSVANRWLIIEGIQKYWMINSAIGAVSNIILNIVLIPVMGINGSALATLLSYAFAYHFAYAFVKRTRNVFHEQNKSMLRVIMIFPAIRLVRQVKSR